jgi:hypothetical protein
MDSDQESYVDSIAQTGRNSLVPSESQSNLSIQIVFDETSNAVSVNENESRRSEREIDTKEIKRDFKKKNFPEKKEENDKIETKEEKKKRKLVPKKNKKPSKEKKINSNDSIESQQNESQEIGQMEDPGVESNVFFDNSQDEKENLCENKGALLNKLSSKFGNLKNDISALRSMSDVSEINIRNTKKQKKKSEKSKTKGKSKNSNFYIVENRQS